MKAFKPSCLAMAVCSTLLSPIYVHAAEQDVSVEKDIEKIVVTGSRIKGVDLEGKQPLVIINADDIRNSGASSISELMNQISQTRGGEGSFSTTESGATSTSTPAGQAAASLRGLGPSSTLTLINGRRVAASSFASGTQNFVDINSIPLAAIERIEVLATGASAIYGADAVAGVINYILKKNYQGTEFNLSYGNSLQSSNEGKANLNLVMGTEFAGGNLTLFADYYDREAFSAQDRGFTKDTLLASSYSYAPKDTPNIYYNSSDVADENGDYLELANPNCKTELVTTEYGEDICAYYRNEDDMLNSELETASLGLIFSKDIGELTWDTDFFFSHSKSTALSSPAFISQLADSNEPGWAPMSALDAVPSLIDLVYPQYYFTNLNEERELQGIQYDARFSSPRTVEVETNAFRLVSTLMGELGEWEWESAVTLSKSESEQKALAGIYNRYKYTAAVNGELCGDGSIADYDYESDGLSCASGNLLARYNPFLEGDTANDALLAMTQEIPTRDGESTVYGWDARITGELFEYNDQIISAAFGVETRKEKITDIPSFNARARAENDYLVDVFGFGSSLSEAERFQWGAFAEFYVPLSESIELQLAGRYDDYDDFGDTFNPKVAITFRPIDNLILRASWATSFRAPSLTQAGVKLRTTSAIYDCGANQAVSDLYCGGGSFDSSANVLELGNKDLRAEESESISIGFAYSPTENTTITMDYWQFEHEDLVDTDMTSVLANAISDASLRHCGPLASGAIGISYDEELCDFNDLSGLTIEDEGANLNEILDAYALYEGLEGERKVLPLYQDHVIQLENTGEQNVSGIDLAIDHKIDFNQGTLSFSVDATHYLEFERNKSGSSELEKLIGTWRYPETIASARVSWSGDALYSSLTLDYTSSYQDDIEGLRGRQIEELNDMGKLDENNERDVDSWLTLRANIGYDFKNMNVNLTVNNLLDEEPPVAYGSTRGFDSLNHDALGLNYRLSMTYFF